MLAPTTNGHFVGVSGQAAFVRDVVESGRSAEPAIMHRSDKLCVAHRKARGGTNYGIYPAMRAERGSLLILNPLVYMSRRKRFAAEETTTNLASFYLFSMVARVSVSRVKRVAWFVHEQTYGALRNVRNVGVTGQAGFKGKPRLAAMRKVFGSGKSSVGQLEPNGKLTAPCLRLRHDVHRAAYFGTSPKGAPGTPGE